MAEAGTGTVTVMVGLRALCELAGGWRAHIPLAAVRCVRWLRLCTAIECCICTPEPHRAEAWPSLALVLGPSRQRSSPAALRFLEAHGVALPGLTQLGGHTVPR